MWRSDNVCAVCGRCNGVQDSPSTCGQLSTAPWPARLSAIDRYGSVLAVTFLPATLLSAVDRYGSVLAVTFLHLVVMVLCF